MSERVSCVRDLLSFEPLNGLYPICGCLTVWLPGWRAPGLAATV
jgi:hypothetical protein